MAKVTFLTSPLVTNIGDLKKSAVNNGLLYIGSYLKNSGHNVEFIDVIFEGWNNARQKTASTIEYGLPDEEITERVRVFNPDIIGINLLATVSYGGFLGMVKKLRWNFPDKIIIAGGAHITALPEKALRDSEGSINYVVCGEGEVVMKRVCSNPLHDDISKLRGIAYLDGKGCFRINPRQSLIENLDSVGSLSIDLVKDIPFTKEPTYAGSAHGKKYIDLMLSRGCPLNCEFCFTPQMWQRKFRKHSPGWISQTLDDLIRAGFEHFIIQDDNFSRGGKWTYEVMDLFKQKEVTWENNGGLELEDLTPEIIKYMADTNCTTLFIPLNLRTHETDVIPEKLATHYKEVLSTAKQAGMYVYTSHIMGFPEQTLEGMKKQAAFAKQLMDSGLSDFHVVYAFSILPGTNRFHQTMRATSKGEYEVKEESGISFHGGWQNWPLYSINSPQIGSRNFSYKEVKGLFFDSIRAINGEKAEQWLSEGQWPK